MKTYVSLSINSVHNPGGQEILSLNGHLLFPVVLYIVILAESFKLGNASLSNVILLFSIIGFIPKANVPASAIVRFEVFNQDICPNEPS